MERALDVLADLFRPSPSEKEANDFLRDFLSPSEILQLAERVLIARLLLKGLSQREVKQELGVSISKVSRCANVLNYGTGAFGRILRSRSKSK